MSRYLSEWRHVQRGATWKTSLHMCDGRTPTPEELPSCYEGSDWSGCTLQQFMDCPYNLANNRQVRVGGWLAFNMINSKTTTPFFGLSFWSSLGSHLCKYSVLLQTTNFSFDAAVLVTRISEPEPTSFPSARLFLFCTIC